MKTIRIKLYAFDELSAEAQRKAIDHFREDDMIESEWEYMQDDAKNIGLQLESYEYGRYAKGEFISSATECAEAILTQHGKACETYKTAKAFLTDLEGLTGQHENIEDVNEREIEELEDDFLKSLLEDYRILMDKSINYQQSDEAIKERIECNEYIFFADGSLADATTYTGKQEDAERTTKKAGRTEVKIGGQVITLK